MPLFKPPIREYIRGGGYIELEEMLGDDLTPARVARISYLSEGTEEADKKLLKKLIDLEHYSPFEQQVFRFFIHGIPMYIGEQLLRHRIASPLKRSFRYTHPEKGVKEKKWEDVNFWNDLVHVPPEFLGLKKHHIDNPEELLNEIIQHFKHSFELYNRLVESGLRKEAARCVLPAGLRTTLYWSSNMRSIMNFMKLRLNKHAQWEMRELAKAMARILLKVVPLTMSYYLEKENLLHLLDE